MGYKIMKKNVLIIIPYFIPAYSYGWPVKVAYDHAIWLIKKWYNVTVVTSDALDSKNRNKVLNEEVDWIKIIRFKNLSNYIAKFFNLYLPFWLNKWLKNNISNFDIVHIHDFFTIFTVLGAKYAYKNNIKYFIQPHGTLSSVRVNSSKKIIKGFIIDRFKNIINYSDWILALTEQEKKEIHLLYKNNNIKLLANGLYLNNFVELKNIDLQKEYNLNKETKIITFLWRIQHIKWLDISFKLLAELNRDFKDWVFLIIWPDEWEKENLIKLSEKLWITNKIIWYWLENTRKKYDLLYSSDIFLFNSRNEGFPMTILESIACKLPVIISQWCNIPEIWDYKAWEIVDNNDFQYIIKKVRYMFENKWEYLDWWSKMLKENYDINLIVNNLIKYYENDK